MNGFRDIEQLSAYLDGQLSPSDSARLESRLKLDPELASAYDDLHSTRSILRKLPSRKAPRNFILTRKMAGLKPPLPRTYFTFRFATAFATILFAFTIVVNSITPRITYNPALVNVGSGGGGCTDGCGGGPGTVFQAPFSAAAEAQVATESPLAEIAPIPTMDEYAPSADAADTERIAETPTAKEPLPASPVEAQGQREVFQVPIFWQAVFLAASVIGMLCLFLIDRFAKRKWQ